MSKVRGSNNKKDLPSQASSEDTSNWDNRAIALPDPKRSAAQLITNDVSSVGNDIDIENPYLEQEQLKSVKHRN